MRPLGTSDPTVIGPYRLLGVLGTGGMGCVYLGQSPSGRRLAIKVIRPHLVEDPIFRERFAREVRAARSVNPLFTAAVVDADTQAPEPWLATTFIDGISLERSVVEQGPMPVGPALALTAGVAEALASIHRVGLVHRDLKPSNILIDADGPHIIDFGLALALAATRMTTSLIVGTPSYMAPERLRGSDAGPPSDIFSLGATLVFATTGHDLIGDGTVYEQILQITEGRFDLTGVPAMLRPLIVRCVSLEAGQRPTAEELTRIVVALGVTNAPPRIPVQRAHPNPVPGPEAPGPSRSAPRYSGPERPIPDRGISGHPLPGRAAAAHGLFGAREPIATRERSEPRSTRPGWSRRGVLALSGGLGTAVLAGGVVAIVGAFRVPSTTSTAVWDRNAVAPQAAGRILWQARSGSDPRGAPTGAGGSSERIVIDGEQHIIALDANQVIARDFLGNRRWVATMPTGLVGIWRWGDAVLVTDARRLWSLNAATGHQDFAIDPVGMAGVPGNGGDHTPTAVGDVTVGTGRAFVNVGTATVAIDREGHRLWSRPTPVADNLAQATAATGTDANWLVTQAVAGTTVDVDVTAAATGKRHWAATYRRGATMPGGPSDAGPPGGGPPGGGPGAPPPGLDGSGDPGWGRSEAHVNDGYLAARVGSDVRVLRLRDGHPIWQMTSPTPVTAIALFDGSVLVAADRITAYELATGAVRWQVAMRGARIAVATEPAIIVAAAEQWVSGLDGDGRVLWRTALPASVAASPPDRLTVDTHVAFLTLAAAPGGTVLGQPGGTVLGQPGGTALGQPGGSDDPPVDVVAIALDTAT